MLGNNIKQAVQILQQAGLVAMPTETVYGLAASANFPAAITKVYSVKGRPSDHPLILHIGDQAALSDYAQQIPSYVTRLIKHFWPGPLTLVLKKTAKVNDVITARQATVAIRQPAHPIALQLIHQLGQAIVAPSANRFGRVSPSSAQHVLDDLGNDVDYILDGGRCAFGIESTIINASKPDYVTILRHGAICTTELANVLGDIPLHQHSNSPQPRVSGNLDSHYAPQKPLLVYQNDAEIQALLRATEKVYVLSYQQPIDTLYHYRMPNNAKDYAYQLYYQLRIADAAAVDKIAIELPPQTDEWLAVRDRLSRAGHG